MTTEIIHPVRRSIAVAVTCPICSHHLKINMDRALFAQATMFPVSHLVLHGTPLHALIVYLDADFKVRGAEGCHSIEIVRDSASFSQLVKIWSNPF
jgi:hypothetical protein